MDRSADWTNKQKAAEHAEKNRDFSAATKLYEEALADAEEFGATDIRLPQSLNILSQDYLEHGQQEKCLGLFKRAWQICDDHFPRDKVPAKQLSDDDRRWAKEGFVACCGLVKVYSDLGQAGATKDFYERAVRYNSMIGDPKLTVQLQRSYDSAAKRLKEMETSFDEALRQANSGNHVKEDAQLLNAALAEWRKESTTTPYPVAEAKLLKIVATARVKLGIRNHDYRNMIGVLFDFYRKNGKYDKARTFIEDDSSLFSSFDVTGSAGAQISPEDTQEACRLAQDFDFLGQIADDTKDREKAIKLYGKALGIYDRYRVKNQTVADVHCRLATAYLAVGRHETEAEQEMRAATALTGDKTPIDWKFQYLTALSEMRRANNDFSGAISALEEEQLLAENNNRLDYSVGVSMGLSNLYQQHDEFDKAADVLEAALKREEKAGNQANSTQMSDVLQILAQVNERRGQPAKAREYLMRRLELLAKLPPADSNQRYTDTYSLLGAVEGQLGNTAAEEKYFREGLAHAEKIQDKQAITEFLIWLGNYLTGGGVTGEGDRCYDRALQLVQAHSEKSWSHLAVITYRTCGFNNCGRGELKLGIEQLRKALSISKQESDDQNIAPPLITEDLYWSSVYLAFGLSLDGRLTESQISYDAAQELIDSKKVSDTRWHYQYYWRRAIAYYLEGNTTKANEMRQRAANVNSKKASEFLAELRSHIRQTASYFGTPMPDVSSKAIFSSALDVLKARDRKCGHNSYFAAFGYLWLGWTFDNAGFPKECDHLQSIADSILKDLKPASARQ